MQVRLDKFVSEAGAYSRQEAKKLISSGSVSVNDLAVKKGDIKVYIQKDIVKINGKIISYSQYVYIMLNKPQGVVSASADKNDLTVVDLVKKDYPKRQLFPAGRLDKTSTGFVLLTDDGGFAHDILSPKHHVPKTYIVTLDAPLTKEIQTAFNNGVTLADGTVLKSAQVFPLEKENTVKVILRQGVYHQIKRMFGVFNIGVNELHRTHIGAVELDSRLMAGEYRELTLQEKDLIYSTINK